MATPKEGYDHTAPWRCSQPHCERCHRKPTYHEYQTARMKRNAEQAPPRAVMRRG